MADLQDLRDTIDAIDEKMARLFSERMDAVAAVARLKKDTGKPTRDEARERQIIESHLAEIPPEYRPEYRAFMNDLFCASRAYQDRVAGRGEKLLRAEADGTPYFDNAFGAVRAARQYTPTDKINATVGSLCDEDGSLVAFDSVWKTYEEIDGRAKAAYAPAIGGSGEFNSAVFAWLNRLGNIRLPHACLATPGGTGALSVAVDSALESGGTLLIPSIGWGTYAVMAKVKKCRISRYQLFIDGKLTTEGIKTAAGAVMKDEGRVTVIINDPCHNPTGASFTSQQWADLVDFFNDLSMSGPVTLINDIAYIDYAADPDRATAYMENFNRIAENVAVILAFSCSKTMTAYGMRLGCAVILCASADKADRLLNAYTRYARSTWSNVNNGFMQCFSRVMADPAAFLKEKKQAVEMLKKRAILFCTQAKRCGLSLYPYTEGFFVTIRVENEQKLLELDEALQKQGIFGVRFPGALRLALCGISLTQTDGLAPRIKATLNSLGN